MTAALDPEYRAIKLAHIGEPTVDDIDLGVWDAGDDDESIPPREWLLGNTFCKKFVSSLIAGGGVGKTSVRIAQCLALATERPVTGEHVFRRSRVLIVSLEDDRDELRRRVRAAMLHHRIDGSEIKGWLYLATPSALGAKLVEMKDGEVRQGQLEAAIVTAIERYNLDLVSLDPFVKSHSVEENANGAIDVVVNTLARIAVSQNVAIDTPHHVSKGPADPGNADRGRGASAFKDGGRLVYSLSPMAPEDAEKFGLGEQERRSLVRIDSAKVNLAAATEAKWFRLVSVPLSNGTETYPNGDEVQAIEPWTPPSAWDGLNSIVLNDILTVIEAGLPNGSRYSSHGSATDRAAWKIVVEHAPDKTEAQGRQIIATWLKTGLLTIAEYHDPERREPAKGLHVNNAKRPT